MRLNPLLLLDDTDAGCVRYSLRAWLIAVVLALALFLARITTAAAMSAARAATGSSGRYRIAGLRATRPIDPTLPRPPMLRLSWFALPVLIALVAFEPDPAAAKTLRWAGRGDMQTADPHAQNDNLTSNINALVYEPLVARDRNLTLVPALATAWEVIDPSTWRFRLRPGVKWHDGSAFTADDVVFSFERARADTSRLRTHANAAGLVRRIDELTIEFVTPGPNPILLEHVALIGIMNRAWVERNRAAKPQDLAANEDMFTARHAMGTGPFVLQSREPGAKTMLSRNPRWWGNREGRFEGNVDEVVYLPMSTDASRVAALIAAEVDIVNDPAPRDVPRLAQTPGIKVLAGPENRIIFLGMDQGRDELLYSSVKGRNPFKDRRVRQALYQAIDIDAIGRTPMRGLARPSGVVLPSPAQSTPELERRLPFDRQASTRLLAEAGYGRGFEITLDCPRDHDSNDEKICQAIAAMWRQVGVNTRVNTVPRTAYFPKLEKQDTSVYLLGWGSTSPDAIFTLQPVMATWNGRGDGECNYGRSSNPALDALIAKIMVEMNPGARLALIREALAAEKAVISVIPLHREVAPWALRAGLSIPHRADNWVTPHWVRLP